MISKKPKHLYVKEQMLYVVYTCIYMYLYRQIHAWNRKQLRLNAIERIYLQIRRASCICIGHTCKLHLFRYQIQITRERSRDKVVEYKYVYKNWVSLLQHIQVYSQPRPCIKQKNRITYIITKIKICLHPLGLCSKR